MSIEKHSFPDANFAIWAETDNINYFVKSDLVPDSQGGVTNVQQNVKAHTRRQYVGDTTLSNVGAHSRTTLVDPGRKSGSAIPGKPFILTDGTETRQFRYTGSFTELHAYLVGDAAMDLELFSPTGTRYMISAAGPAEALAKTR